MLPCVSMYVSSIIPPDIELNDSWGFDLLYDNESSVWKVKRAEGSESYYEEIQNELKNNSNLSDDQRYRLENHLIQVSDADGENFQILGDEELPFLKLIEVGLHTFSLEKILVVGSKPSDEKSSSTDETTSSPSDEKSPSTDEATSSSSSTPPAIEDISENFKKMGC